MGVKLLGKIKVYELAKELDVESKKLVEIAANHGIVAKSHLSSISEEECNILRKAVKGDNTKKVEKPNQDNKKEKMKIK